MSETVSLIFELEDRASKEFKKFQKQLKEIKKEAKSAGEELDDLGDETDKVGKGLKKAGEGATSMGSKLKGAAGALSLIAGAMGAVIAQVVALNKELIEQANFGGVSVETMQKLGFAATQTGGSFEDVADALNEITLKSTEAAKIGSGAFVDIAKLAGLTIEEFAKLTPEEQLYKFADATKDMDANLRNLLQDELGSDTFIRLNKLLSLGSDGFKKYGKEAERIGIITEAESQKVAGIGQAFESLSQTFKTLSTKSVAAISEEITFLIKKTQDLIIGFSEGTFARPISASFNLIGNALKAVGLVIFGLLKTAGDFIGIGLNKIESGLKSTLLSIHSTLKETFDTNLLDDSTVITYKSQIERLDHATSTTAKNMINNFKGVKESAEDVVGSAKKFALLTAADQSLLERAQNGLVKSAEDYNRAILLSGTIYGENNTRTQELIFNQRKLTEETAKTVNEVKKLESLSNSIQLDLNFQKAQIELLKFKGDLLGAFELKASFDNKQLLDEANALKLSLEKSLTSISDDSISFNPNIKLGDDDFDQLLDEMKKEVSDVKGNEEFVVSSNKVIEKLRVINEYQRLIEGQVGIEALAQQVEQLQLQMQLGDVTPDQVLAKMNEQLLLMQETLPANSTELLAFELQVKKMTESLDVMKGVSEHFAESFSDGFAQAFTDSLQGGEKFVDGMKNLLRDLALSFIQAAIKALILTAIMRGINGGSASTTSFGQDFSANFGSSFGVDVPKAHNGTGSGTMGDENGLRNGTKSINAFNPAGSLNSDEIFAVLKKDESVVQTSSLSSPTGVGSQNVVNETSITNVITSDEVGAMMETPQNVDKFVNMMNANRSRINI